ncbi:MAG: GyrI-like domain-containing protein [Candidatus Omnitrophota bacterium]|nr:GyrI-like domain-containing protein [Candidatus Omnitrophota bacterium]
MKVFTVISIVLVVLIGGFLFYQGIFSPVKLREQVVGGYWLVYQGHIGPYEKVGPVIKKICQSLSDDKVETKVSFGLYYDNPAKVEKSKLKSEVGAILDEKYYDRIDDLRSKYNIKQIKKRNSLVAEFPIRNNLSYMIGHMKVYPAMEKYCKEKNIDIESITNGFGLEIYDMKNKKTTYSLSIE